MNMSRWACGHTRDYASNGNTMERLEVENITQRCRISILRWFGHVKRRYQEYIRRQMLDMVPPGRRRRDHLGGEEETTWEEKKRPPGRRRRDHLGGEEETTWEEKKRPPGRRRDHLEEKRPPGRRRRDHLGGEEETTWEEKKRPPGRRRRGRQQQRCMFCVNLDMRSVEKTKDEVHARTGPTIKLEQLEEEKEECSIHSLLMNYEVDAG